MSSKLHVGQTLALGAVRRAAAVAVGQGNGPIAFGPKEPSDGKSNDAEKSEHAVVKALHPVLLKAHSWAYPRRCASTPRPTQVVAFPFTLIIQKLLSGRWILMPVLAIFGICVGLSFVAVAPWPLPAHVKVVLLLSVKTAIL